MDWASVLQFVPAVVSLWPRSSVCECRCHLEADNRVLQILEKQLDRCGPANLSPVASGGGGLSTFFFGLVCGVVLTLVAPFVVQRVARAKAKPVFVRGAEVSGQLALGGPVTPTTRRKA